MRARAVVAEALDNLSADDPAALQSRRDLRRVHLAMGTRRILLRALRATRLYRQHAGPLRVLELGAGDGTLMLGVAQALNGAWPSVELRLLDQHDLVQPPILAGFAACGWAAKPWVVDVLDWARPPDGLTARARDGWPTASSPPWDLIIVNLFLHHFEAAPLARLLVAAAARSRCFVACEPRRAALALAGSHLVGLLGANAVTRDDAVLSVRAGFCGQELTALWPSPSRLADRPDAASPWQLDEFPAGLFSHCFTAERRDGAAGLASPGGLPDLAGAPA